MPPIVQFINGQNYKDKMTDEQWGAFMSVLKSYADDPKKAQIFVTELYNSLPKPQN